MAGRRSKGGRSGTAASRPSRPAARRPRERTLPGLVAGAGTRPRTRSTSRRSHQRSISQGAGRGPAIRPSSAAARRASRRGGLGLDTVASAARGPARSAPLRSLRRDRDLSQSLPASSSAIRPCRRSRAGRLGKARRCARPSPRRRRRGARRLRPPGTTGSAVEAAGARTSTSPFQGSAPPARTSRRLPPPCRRGARTSPAPGTSMVACTTIVPSGARARRGNAARPPTRRKSCRGLEPPVPTRKCRRSSTGGRPCS